MAYGDGRLYQDDRDYRVAVVNLPPGPDGKRRRKTIRRKSKKAVVDERLRLLGERTNHGDLITSSPPSVTTSRTGSSTQRRTGSGPAP